MNYFNDFVQYPKQKFFVFPQPKGESKATYFNEGNT